MNRAVQKKGLDHPQENLCRFINREKIIVDKNIGGGGTIFLH